MNDFLSFKTMITPFIIRILFLIGVVVCVIMGTVTIGAGIYAGGDAIWVALLTGIGTIVGGPIVCRIYAELLIILFQIHAELKQMNNRE